MEYKYFSMKISFYLPRVYFKPGGGVKIVLEYANYLSQMGDDVKVYYYSHGNYGELGEARGIKRIVIGLFTAIERVAGRAIGARLWFPLNKKVKQNVINSAGQISESDVIIATAIQLVEPVFSLPQNYGKKVYLIQGFETWQNQEEELYRIYNLDIYKIVVSKWLQGIVDAHSLKKSIFIPNCINENVFINFGLKRETHSIIFQYRKAKIKGCEYAFQVIEKLYRLYPDLKVTIVSREKKHPKLLKCCRYLYNLTPKEVANANNKAQIFMCTTLEEGFGLPGLEAMACGCALVSTNYEAVFDYAVDGVNALLSPIKDVNKMVENIVKLFEDEMLMRSIVNEGIKTAINRASHISYTNMRNTLLDIYEGDLG